MANAIDLSKLTPPEQDPRDAELDFNDDEPAEKHRHLAIVPDVPRAPATRGDCIDGPRPCPALRCRYHLGETGGRAGHTCALDVADQGPHSLEEVGAFFDITRERVRQIEAAALDALGTSWRTRDLVSEMRFGPSRHPGKPTTQAERAAARAELVARMDRVILANPTMHHARIAEVNDWNAMAVAKRRKALGLPELPKVRQTGVAPLAHGLNKRFHESTKRGGAASKRRGKRPPRDTNEES